MQELKALVRAALAEGIGQGDITTNATIRPDSRCQAWLIAKQDGILSSTKAFRAVFDCLDADIHDWKAIHDGASFERGDRLIEFQGWTAPILTGERVALNFIQHLTGIATFAGEFRKAVEGLPVRLCDTRKTTPLLRKLEKEAVVHGGCTNHRYALFDGVLIKENHITGAGGIRPALERAIKGTHHLMKVGIEVTNIDELHEAIAGGADAVLLDNMSVEMIGEAVKICEDANVVVEASGNITMENVRAVAEAGVHLISIGALTHSAPAVDLSLIIKNV